MGDVGAFQHKLTATKIAARCRWRLDSGTHCQSSWSKLEQKSRSKALMITQCRAAKERQS